MATSEGAVLKDIPKPKLEPYLVLVRVKAVALNRADLMMLKSLTITASSIYTYFFREEYQQSMEFLINWLNTKDDLLSVTKTFQLEEIVQAHQWLEDQHSIGKVAVVMEN